MTKQESFKRRVRERMAKTGERYSAARASLLDQAHPNRRRIWVSEPEMSDAAVQEATGKSWDDWCDIIDTWGLDGDHPAIAAKLAHEMGIDPWWSQGVTVGYERITGLRLPFQRPDGTFTAGKSKTVTVDAAELRAVLLDDDQRGDLFPGYETELLSKPSAKAVRISVGPGVAHVGIEAKADGRAKITVDHRKLATYDDVTEWKFYWAEWLEAIAGS